MAGKAIRDPSAIDVLCRRVHELDAEIAQVRAEYFANLEGYHLTAGPDREDRDRVLDRLAEANRRLIGERARVVERLLPARTKVKGEGKKAKTSYKVSRGNPDDPLR